VSGLRQAAGELTIGVIGPHELVERIMLAGPTASGQPPGLSGSSPAAPRRLVAAAYRDEQEAADMVLRLGLIDACLFASRVPYEVARKAGVLTSPATFVPLSGSALLAALLRASRDGGRDLSRASIDVLSHADVQDAFAEFGLPARGLHVREDLASPAVLASFHERLFRRGESTMAFTCLPSVASRLSAADVPVFIIGPTGHAISWALQTAVLLGGYRRLDDAQLAVAVVEVPTLRDSARRASPRQAREELRLTVHRFLVQEAQRMHATVSPTSDYAFLITATRGSLASATDGFRFPPFTERARSELGVTIETGVGMGRSALEAEAHARAILGRTPGPTAARGFALGLQGQPLIPTPRHPAAGAPGRVRALETLARLADKLPEASATMIVDADTAGRLLDVTPRTARRLLHALVEEGLAWPLPPSRSPQPGRPRQFYRLLAEKLERRPDR
jgi:DNA-binding transcriptional ArsR family regulator